MSERGPKPGVNIESDYSPVVIEIANAVDAISLQRSINIDEQIERTIPLNLEVHQKFTRYVETAHPHLPNYYVLMDVQKAEAKRVRGSIEFNGASRTYFIPEGFEIYEVRGEDDLWMQYGFNQILGMPIPDDSNERFEEKDLPEEYSSISEFKNRIVEFTRGNFSDIDPYEVDKRDGKTRPKNSGYPVWDATSHEIEIVEAIEKEIAQSHTTDETLVETKEAFDQARKTLMEIGPELEKEGAQKIKDRVINFINVFAAQYSVPDILTIQDPKSRRGKMKLKVGEMLGSEPKARDFQYIYLLIPEKRLVTGRLDRGVLKIKSPKVVDAQDLPLEDWGLFDYTIIHDLTERVPGLREKVDEITTRRRYEREGVI